MNTKKMINRNRIKLLASTILWTLIGIFVSKTAGIFNLNPIIHTLITIVMVESINISLNYGTIIENKYLHNRLKQGGLDYIDNEKQETNEKVLQNRNDKINIQELNSSIIKPKKAVNEPNLKKEEIIDIPNNIIDYEERHIKVLKKKLERKVKSI